MSLKISMAARIVVCQVSLTAAAFSAAAQPDDLAQRIATGWMAHMICSSVFVSQRELDHVMNVEFRSSELTPQVDHRAKTVTVTGPDSDGSTAVHREGLGCTLALGESVERLREVTVPPRQITNDDDALWPAGERLFGGDSDVDYDSLNRVLEDAVSEAGSSDGRGTRGVVVIHKGRLVGEAYAPGYPAEMPLYGASMTKTVGAMLIGRLVQAGELSISDRELRPEWGDDARREILLDELLKAVSGLEFAEQYTGNSDANVMLFTARSMARYAANKPLAASPGTRWSYSSGTSNLIMQIARETFEDDDVWLRFPNEALFEPLGLRTAVFETDTSGTFVGSSFLWANPRDFARFGLLILQDGVWEGERLLPEGWVDYMSTPHPGNDRLNYGAQIWLVDAENAFAPAPAVEMRGYGGQYVNVEPAHELVVVRMGWDIGADAWNQRELVERVIATIEPSAR